MSSPSFLLANDNNHTLLHSLLEAINAMVEHQYQRKAPIAVSSMTVLMDSQTIPTSYTRLYGPRGSSKRCGTSHSRVDKKKLNARISSAKKAMAQSCPDRRPLTAYEVPQSLEHHLSGTSQKKTALLRLAVTTMTLTPRRQVHRYKRHLRYNPHRQEAREVLHGAPR